MPAVLARTGDVGNIAFQTARESSGDMPLLHLALFLWSVQLAQCLSFQVGGAAGAKSLALHESGGALG